MSPPILTLHGTDEHMETLKLLSEQMTNEEAINWIQEEYDYESRAVFLAKMFAMEDIIEYDVLEWVKMPVSAGLSEFVTHARTANEIVIDHNAEVAMRDKNKMEAVLHDFAEKMEVVMIAMQLYTDIHSMLRKKIQETHGKTTGLS